MSDGPAEDGRGEPQYRQVARNLRNRIHAGKLTDGEALPSTRELAEQWSVSVFTINEAMRVLADEGLVVSKSRSHRIVHFPEGRDRMPRRPDQPRVVLIGGWPGSGKSELGRVMGRLAGWAVLDKDTITRPVVEAALELLGSSPHDRESETYRDLVRPREYEALMAATAENVECGNSAVVAAPFIAEFRDRAWIDRTVARLAALGADTHLVWVVCDTDTMHGYMRHRSAARDVTKLADWAAYLATIDVDFRPPVPHEVVDNSASSRPLQDQARDLVARVAR